MRVLVIVVTFNGLKWVDKCFGSLRDSDVELKTLVIDNGSSDGTVSYLKAHFPEVDIYESNENLGFARANNIGIKQAIESNADYVFLLNQDAWIEKNTISELISTFSVCENTGIAVPIQLNGSYSNLDDCFSGYLSNEIISDLYMKHLRDHYVLSFVNAAAWMISVECIKKVGGFDTLLFYHYGEDINYCQRLRYHHFNLVLNTRCSFCHDRESRVGHEEEYRARIMKLSPFDSENRLYGDINIAFDIQSLIRSHYKALCFAFLSFSSSRIKKHKQMIRQLHIIQQSRVANMVGGPVWL
ncbi:MAG: glycosyltransferase family 2 protein [Bacteroidales bacterium]|nr:glycosyltransferase family 2 protein [Bacteroidales bacterium]